MFKRPIRSWAALTLILVAGLTGCDTDRGPTAVTAVPSQGDQIVSWLSLVSTNSSETATTVTQVVGSHGGMITVGNHSLLIPRRALTEDLEFTVTVVGGDHIEVDLSARRVSDGSPVSTFLNPLTLRLSYANTSVSNPNRLKNVYLVEGRENGPLLPLQSAVSTLTKTVSSPLYHFSIYGMAME